MDARACRGNAYRGTSHPIQRGRADYLKWTRRGLFLPTATAWTAAARGTVGFGAGFALVSAATTGKVDGGGRFTPGRH